jgi:hypothetical protein
MWATTGLVEKCSRTEHDRACYCQAARRLAPLSPSPTDSLNYPYQPSQSRPSRHASDESPFLGNKCARPCSQNASTPDPLVMWPDTTILIDRRHHASHHQTGYSATSSSRHKSISIPAVILPAVPKGRLSPHQAHPKAWASRPSERPKYWKQPGPGSARAQHL